MALSTLAAVARAHCPTPKMQKTSVESRSSSMFAAAADSRFPPPPRAHPSLQSHPTDIELAKVLYNRVRSSSDMSWQSPLIIYEADVYAADPDDLTQQYEAAVAEDGKTAWYFLTQLLLKHPNGKRMRRCVDSGVWHDEGKFISVVVAGVGGVRRNSYSFQRKGPDGKLERTGWVMRQYQLEDGNGQNLVLCKIYSQGKVQRSPRHESSSVVAPNGQASRAVEAAMAAAKKLQQKIEEVMLGKIETATISETAAFEAAKASLAKVENAIKTSNMRVEGVKDMLKAATVVDLPEMMEVAMASTKAMVSAMAVTKATDLTSALKLAKTQADVTVKLVTAFRKGEDKVAVLMAAEAAAEAAARAVLLMVRAAKGQAAKRRVKETLDVLMAAIAAAEEAKNTVEATAFAVTAVGISHDPGAKLREWIS